MWFLAYSDENFAQLQEGSRYIKKNEDVNLLLESIAVDEQEQEKTVHLFNEARQSEHEGLVAECAKYLQEIKRETANNILIRYESSLARGGQISKVHNDVKDSFVAYCVLRKRWHERIFGVAR
ncbi:MAG TPA: hypothetical protein PKZ09_01565 [Bacillota bacterium]|nr:hypothetical protein [Bacillota bacterium]